MPDGASRQNRQSLQAEGWCDKAEAISAEMRKKHKTDLLNAIQLYRFAKRLKYEHEIHRMDLAVDSEPSPKAIKRQLNGIRKSIERIAAFARDVQEASEASERRTPVNNDGWEKLGALNSIAQAGQRWELTERKKHDQAFTEWRRSERRDITLRPQDRLGGHMITPSVMSDGHVLPYADVMVRKWFEQARFMKEILKDDEIAVRHVDDLNWASAEASLAGRRMPDLFSRTYPGKKLGSPGRDGSFKHAAGYSFTQLAIDAIAGRRIASETIRTHVQNEKRRAKA